MSRKKKYTAYPTGYCLPAILIYAIFFVIPMLIGLIMAFTDWSSYDMFHFHFIGFSNFQYILKSKLFPLIMRNTFYYAIATVVLKNLFGFVLALLLDNALKLTKIYRSVFFMPCIFSSMIVCLIFTAIYNPQNGILNELLRLLHLDSLTTEWLFNEKTAMNSICSIEIWQWAGFHMTIYLAALQSISKDYFEAAAVDGASGWQQLIKIKIPLMASSFGMNITISIIGGLKVFDKVYATTNGGPNDATQVFSMYVYKTYGQGLWGVSSAYNLVFTVIIFILSILVFHGFQKREVAA